MNGPETQRQQEEDDEAEHGEKEDRRSSCTRLAAATTVEPDHLPEQVSASPTTSCSPCFCTGSADHLRGCRHWRYISSFHGPWLQLPPEILDSLAHQNFTMPAPRLVDPAVFYDVVKIRKAVDDAAQDSVRASTGLSNTAMNGRMDFLGAGGGPGGQLSKERVFKIRQKAVRLLSKAFALDEVAASVATMQATSTVEDVGQHVLKREPNSTGALSLLVGEREGDTDRR